MQSISEFARNFAGQAWVYVLGKFSDESVSNDLKGESNCSHVISGSISERAKSMKVADALARCTLVITPHHEFLLQLNEIIQMLGFCFINSLKETK